jgi:hypothetical protein
MAVTDAPPVAAAAPRTPAALRWRRGRRWGLLLVVLVLVALKVASELNASWEESQARQPLRAAAAAADRTDRVISVIDRRTAETWSSGSRPTEQRLRMSLGTGNHLLEPAFYLLARDGWSVRGMRCYYVAVQPGGGQFDAERVSGVGQVCYLGKSRNPYSSRYTSVDGPYLD